MSAVHADDMHATGTGPRSETAGCKIHGNRQKVIVFGSIAADGRPCLERTTGLIRTFIRFFEELHRRFGRIAVIMDNAPQYTGARVRRYIKENHNISAIALPVATLELNATEYRHQLKQDVAVYALR